MPERETLTVRIDADALATMRGINARQGSSLSRQIEHAVLFWLRHGGGSADGARPIGEAWFRYCAAGFTVPVLQAGEDAEEHRRALWQLYREAQEVAARGQTHTGDETQQRLGFEALNKAMTALGLVPEKVYPASG